MENRITKGFAMVVVIMMIATSGTAMFFLTNASNTMMSQANDAYLNACRRNLIASGIAWAETNIRNEQYLNKSTELNVTAMNLTHADLNVTVNVSSNTQPSVRVSTSCSRGRLNLTSDDTYKIE